MAAEISFKNIKRHDVQKIGMAYINHLVENRDYDAAARSVLSLVQVYTGKRNKHVLSNEKIYSTERNLDRFCQFNQSESKCFYLKRVNLGIFTKDLNIKLSGGGFVL